MTKKTNNKLPRIKDLLADGKITPHQAGQLSDVMRRICVTVSDILSWDRNLSDVDRYFGQRETSILYNKRRIHSDDGTTVKMGVNGDTAYIYIDRFSKLTSRLRVTLPFPSKVLSTWWSPRLSTLPAKDRQFFVTHGRWDDVDHWIDYLRRYPGRFSDLLASLFYIHGALAVVLSEHSKRNRGY